MPRFTLLFKLQPPGIFGLPDGDRVVVSAKPGRTIEGPWLDTRSGQISSHGTLSEYRQDADALSLQIMVGGLELRFRDNFLFVDVEAQTAQVAANRVLPFVDTFTQALTAQHGVVFAAKIVAVQDEAGTPFSVQTGPVTLSLVNATVFDITELRKRIERAIEWTQAADTVSKKALLYFEHACLLNDFGRQLPPLSHHSSFSQALAFLQMFKALTALVGEPGTDKDYQRRWKKLGLASDFWSSKVKPLYTVRCEEDVAHYSHSLPEPEAYTRQFLQAATVFVEAFGAYIRTTAAGRPGS